MTLYTCHKLVQIYVCLERSRQSREDATEAILGYEGLGSAVHTGISMLKYPVPPGKECDERIRAFLSTSSMAQVMSAVFSPPILKIRMLLKPKQ